MEKWKKYYDWRGRKTWENGQYKIKLGRPLVNFFARSWIGYKFVDGDYRYASSYYFEQFDSPDNFIRQIEYEYNLPYNRDRKNRLYKKLSGDLNA